MLRVRSEVSIIWDREEVDGGVDHRRGVVDIVGEFLKRKCNFGTLLFEG